MSFAGGEMERRKAARQRGREWDFNIREKGYDMLLGLRLMDLFLILNHMWGLQETR